MRNWLFHIFLLIFALLSIFWASWSEVASGIDFSTLNLDLLDFGMVWQRFLVNFPHFLWTVPILCKCQQNIALAHDFPRLALKKKMRFSTPQKIKHHCRFGMENYKPKNRWKVGFGRLLGFIWEKFGATWGVFWTLLGAAWPFWWHCKSSLFKSGSKMNSKRPVGLILQSLMIFSLAFFILFFRFVLWVFDILPPYPIRVLNNCFLCFC